MSGKESSISDISIMHTYPQRIGMDLWRKDLDHLVPWGKLAQCLGGYIGPRQQILKWEMGEKENTA